MAVESGENVVLKDDLEEKVSLMHSMMTITKYLKIKTRNNFTFNF